MQQPQLLYAVNRSAEREAIDLTAVDADPIDICQDCAASTAWVSVCCGWLC